MTFGGGSLPSAARASGDQVCVVKRITAASSIPLSTVASLRMTALGLSRFLPQLAGATKIEEAGISGLSSWEGDFCDVPLWAISRLFL